MRLAGPVTVVSLDRRYGILNPLAVVRAPIDGQNHSSEEWRLRAGQVISSIRIENFSIVADLIAHIVDNVLRLRYQAVRNSPRTMK